MGITLGIGSVLVVELKGVHGSGCSSQKHWHMQGSESGWDWNMRTMHETPTTANIASAVSALVSLLTSAP